jgi:hypothetical protein
MGQTPLLLMDRGILAGELVSAEGVRQGDVLGSLLFALSMKDDYAACIENLNCQAVAVVDDFYLFGPPDQVFQAFDKFADSLPDGGLKLNLPKCQALLPSSPPASLVQDCQDRYLPHSTLSILALGTILSRDPILVSEYLLNQVIKLHKPFFTTLLDQRLTHQHFFTLLRFCMLPRMNYWSRTTHPGSFSLAARKFDQLVSDTFCQRLNLPALTDVAHAQLQLPVRLGGFGLASVQIVSPASWYSSFAQSFTRIHSFVPSLDTLTDEKVPVPFVTTLSNCISFLSQYKFPKGSGVVASPEDFWSKYSRQGAPAGSQRIIMTAVNNDRAEGIIRGIMPRTNPDRVRLSSLQAPYSGSWLITPPIDSAFILKDVHFSLAVRLRLGLAPFDDIKRCVCADKDSLVEDPQHFQYCHSMTSATIVRHDHLVQDVARVARMCGVTTRIEPKVDDEDNSRTDGELYFHAQSAHFDMCVVFPASQKYRKAHYPLGAAAWRERDKVRDYGDRAARQGALFYPGVMEVYGGLGVRLKELIAKIAEEGELNSVKTINGMTVKTYLSRALSFTLQRGNAMVDILGSKRSRARLHRLKPQAVEGL